MSTVQLSIVVPLFNCLAHTQAMLQSLQSSLPDGLRYEIILVDDGSTDGTREWLAALPAPCRVILNETNLGYAAANNRGAAVATGESLLLLNNDLLFPRPWLEPMLTAQASLGAEAGLVGNIQRTVATREVDHSGLIINEKGKPEHDRQLPWRAWLPHPWSVRRVAALTGACLLVPRRLFLDSGGFSEEFINGGEDVDLAFRLAQQGHRHVVALRSVVLHHVSASPGRKRHNEINSYRLALRWREQLVRHGAPAWARHYLWKNWSSPGTSRNAWAAAETLVYILRLRRHPPPHVIMGIRAAIDDELARWRQMIDAEL
jgi:O-antigen biosynthesis protein